MTGPNDLVGRTALVTGGGSGLGRQIALALAAAGVEVVVVGRDAGKLDAVVGEITARGQVAVPYVADVASPGDVDRLCEDLADREVSIVVNNAGIGGPVADLIDIAVDDWDEVFAINVRGTFLVCQAFLPAMVDRAGGDVINVASVTGKRPLPGRTPYAASKMAVIGLTQTLAFEVGSSGVRVNTLSPGPVRGERMSRNFRLEAERRGIEVEQAEREFVSRAALGRMLEEHEVGDAVVAMLQMPAISGADIDLSAGMIAR